MPRPAGFGGGCRPPRRRDPRRRSRSRVGTAKSGVPMKTMRSGITRRSSGVASSAPGGRLGELLDHHVALQLREVVDEQPPSRWSISCWRQVARSPFGLDLLALAVAIEIAHAHRRRPLDLGVVFRDRQAALLVDRALVRADQTISGLTRKSGVGSAPPSSLATSMAMSRRGTPTWIAARPMPGAAYMVSSMSSIKRRRSSSMRSIGALLARRDLSGNGDDVELLSHGRQIWKDRRPVNQIGSTRPAACRGFPRMPIVR